MPSPPRILSSHEAIATFQGTKGDGSSSDDTEYACFAMDPSVDYVNFSKSGPDSKDAKLSRFSCVPSEQPAEIANALKQLAIGDRVRLLWTHEIEDGASTTRRRISILEKIDEYANAPGDPGSSGSGEGNKSYGAFSIDMSDYLNNYAGDYSSGASKVKAVVSDQRGQNRVTLKFSESTKSNAETSAMSFEDRSLEHELQPLTQDQTCGLLRLSKRLPWYEGAVLKHLILDRAPALLLTVSELQNSSDTSSSGKTEFELGAQAVGNSVREAVAHCIIEHTADSAHQLWMHIFREPEYTPKIAGDMAKISRDEVLHGGGHRKDSGAGAGAGAVVADIRKQAVDARYKEAKEIVEAHRQLYQGDSDGPDSQVQQGEQQKQEQPLPPPPPPPQKEAAARAEYISHTSLTYGEVDFFSMATVLERVGVEDGQSFWDLGSGTGRAVVAAALLYGHKLSGCYGMELLPALYDASLRVQERCIEAVAAAKKRYSRVGTGGGGSSSSNGEWTKVEMHCADIITDLRWLSGDIVFANSTCFDIALMRALAAVAGGMRPGAWLITLTRRVESDDFELVDKRNYSMSWGTATCFVHRRRPEPRRGSSEKKQKK